MPPGEAECKGVRGERAAAARRDRRSGRLVPEAPSDLVTEAWWEAKAADWGVDDVRIVPLTDATLLEEWGPRYHVFMRKRAAERKWPSWQDDMVTGGF